jgi:hypothetical protein
MGGRVAEELSAYNTPIPHLSSLLNFVPPRQ